jgi:hypothetical protein
MSFVQKQHVELVLTYTDPSPDFDYLVVNGKLWLNHRCIKPIGCRLPIIVPAPAQLPTTYHYTIISRVVHGRFLLFRQIRWMSVGPNDRDRLLVLHPIPCPVLGTEGQSTSPTVKVTTEYGEITKCPHCVSEYVIDGLIGKGVHRIWQDLGSEEDPRHACFTDMVTGMEPRRAGTLAELFGPV